MTQIGEAVLAGALLTLAFEVWMTEHVASGIQLYTAAAVGGLLVVVLARWRESRKDDGMPPAV